MKYIVKEKDMLLRILVLTLATILLILLTFLNPFGFSVIHDYFLMASISLSLMIMGLYAIIHYLGVATFKGKQKFRYYYYHAMDFAMMLVVSLVILMTLFSFVFFPARVQQSSMQPNLQPEDRLIVSLNTKNLDRFEIVVIETARMEEVSSGLFEDGDLLIKRIIGLPGETLYFQNGNLYVKNVMTSNTYTYIEEPFLLNEDQEFYYGGISTKTNDFHLEDICYIGGDANGCIEEGMFQIPSGYYFVMGDNRDFSVDSREIGLIHEDQIIGRATLHLESIFKIRRLR